MGRHPKFNGAEFMRTVFALTAKCQRRPTGGEIARELKVSSRTAWRYIRKFMECEECPTCKGSGWIKLKTRR